MSERRVRRPVVRRSHPTVFCRGCQQAVAPNAPGTVRASGVWHGECYAAYVKREEQEG